MSGRKKDPLRQLTDDERQTLERVAHSRSERVSRARRAKALLAVADSKSYTESAKEVGGRCMDTVSNLVSRFNKEGLEALNDHQRQYIPEYGEKEKDRILLEFKRKPDPETDGTKVWSLTLLQRALRNAPDGLPHVSTFTILKTLHEAGYSWQKDRTWCKTGTVQRKRKGEVVTVTDPDAEEKRADRAGL